MKHQELKKDREIKKYLKPKKIKEYKPKVEWRDDWQLNKQ